MQQKAFRALRLGNYALAAACLVLFVAALIGGDTAVGLVLLFAAALWAAVGTYWGRRAGASRPGRPRR